MCVSVVIDGKVLETLGEVQRAVGRKHMKTLPDYAAEIPGKSCCCPLDVRATAQSAGFKCMREDWDPMRFIFTKRA